MMLKPMLAKLIPKPFSDPEYIWETKYDGIRAIFTVTTSSQRTIQSRSGSDKTQLFPEINPKTKKPCILDGELVSADGAFNRIQHRANRINGIQQAIRDYPAQYVIFDVLEVDGINLIYTPLIRRKEILNELVIPSNDVLVAEFVDDGEALFAKMVAEGREGVIGKLRAGIYQEGKRGWLKVKATRTENFVICGYTIGTGWRESTFGALVLGKPNDKGEMAYVGCVGTGFNNQEIADLRADMRGISLPVSPFGRCTSEVPQGTVWVKPQIKVKVRFLEYTNFGILRFPAYKGRVK